MHSHLRLTTVIFLIACEFEDAAGLSLVLKHQAGTRSPLEKQYPFYMVIETNGSNEEHDQAKLSKFLEDAMADSLIEDGALAQDGQQANQFWKLREAISESAGKEGAVYKYDVSIPLEYEFSCDQFDHFLLSSVLALFILVICMNLYPYYGNV